MAEVRIRFRRTKGEALYVQSSTVPGRQTQRDAGLRDVGTLRDREARFQAQGVFAGRLWFPGLFDIDRDAPRPRGAETRACAALRRCLDHRLVQLPLRR